MPSGVNTNRISRHCSLPDDNIPCDTFPAPKQQHGDGIDDYRKDAGLRSEGAAAEPLRLVEELGKQGSECTFSPRAEAKRTRLCLRVSSGFRISRFFVIGPTTQRA